MEIIVMYSTFFVLYAIYTFCILRRSRRKNKIQPELIKRTFGKYYLSIIIFLVSYILLLSLSLLLAFIIGDGLLDFEENSEYILFISLEMTVTLPSIGLLPIQAISRLLNGSSTRIISEEKYVTQAKYFSGQGRIGRLRYFGTLMLIYIGMPLIWGMLMYMMIPMQISEGAKEIIPSITILLMAVFMIYWNIVTAVKRFHDLDRPRRHAWLLLIPLYNIYLGLMLVFVKGSFGDNRFGPDPIESSSNINELCSSFPGIDVNKNQYVVTYSYESIERASEDFTKLKNLLSEYNENIYMQVREYTDNAAARAFLVFFFENPLKFSSAVTWLGKDDYGRGRKLISSDNQKEYFDLDGYKELYASSRAIEI